jgi:hypothetical protein
MTQPSSENILSDAMTSIALDPTLGRGIATLRPRTAEFASETEMMLAGIAAVPEARRLADRRLDAFWADAIIERVEEADEVVIGAGPHAAVYCAARVLMGFPKPTVIERGRVGGAFAASFDPSFWLNSRNRPGRLGFPGEGLALNYLPGALVQPASLSSDEFQDNTKVSFPVRTTLAKYANVRKATVVAVDLSQGERAFRIELDNGAEVYCDRALDARGLGDPFGAALANGTTIVTFAQLMARMDTAFPLRRLDRVAVVGSGDAARCSVESFLGIAPASQFSVATLDFVRAIDWYGPGLPLTSAAWRDVERGRYQAIGSSLRAVGLGRERLRVIDEFGVASPALGQAYVNERLYDLVVLATGSTLPSLPGVFDEPSFRFGSEPAVAQRYGGVEAYRIGAAAAFGFSSRESEQPFASIGANTRALFRNIGRTGALGTRLAAPVAA